MKRCEWPMHGNDGAMTGHCLNPGKVVVTYATDAGYTTTRLVCGVHVPVAERHGWTAPEAEEDATAAENSAAGVTAGESTP